MTPFEIININPNEVGFYILNDSFILTDLQQLSLEELLK